MGGIATNSDDTKAQPNYAPVVTSSDRGVVAAAMSQSGRASTILTPQSDVGATVQKTGDVRITPFMPGNATAADAAVELSDKNYHAKSNGRILTEKEIKDIDSSLDNYGTVNVPKKFQDKQDIKKTFPEAFAPNSGVDWEDHEDGSISIWRTSKDKGDLTS